MTSKQINNVQNISDNTNRLVSTKYLIPAELHNQLFYNSNKHFRKNKEHTVIDKDSLDAVYIVSFRRLNKNTNVLVYNYVKYPFMFLESLFVYFMLRSIYINAQEFSDKKHYFVAFDNTLTKDLNDFVECKNIDSGINLRYQLKDVDNYLQNIKFITNTNLLIEIINNVTYINNIENLSILVDLSVKKEFKDVINKIFEGYDIYKGITAYKEDNLINSSVYVVKDLQTFVDNINNMGYRISEGPQKWRGQINSINSFLSTLDFDYRSSVYKHYEYHKSIGNLNPTQYPVLKPWSFSFNTIHQNIGNVRWYSSKAKKQNRIGYSQRSFSTSSVHLNTNRNILINENFVLIKDIINNNSHLDDLSLQEKIEKCLNTQENIFSSENIIDTRLSFSKETLEYLKTKQSELNKLLNIPFKKNGKKSITFSEQLTPWCETIQKELGVKYVVDLLLSYYMSILTRENLNSKDSITPGIPSMTAFTQFGKIICNKYIHSKYTKYKEENPNKNTTLSQFISSNIDYESMKDQVFCARIGGNFVWNLCVVDLLQQVMDQSVQDRKDTVLYLRITDESRKYFIEKDVMVYHLPLRLPMVCPPKPYVYSKNPLNNKLGGFLMNDVLYTAPVIKNPIKIGVPTELNEDNIIIDEVNGLASTPFKVNTDTLDYIIEYGISKNILLDPEKVGLRQYISNPYKGYNKRDSKSLRSFLSKWILEKHILNIASIYSTRKKIYFPTRLDFRTRIYTDTDYFDYQKGDLARGLILFAEPGKIYKYDVEAINYFKAFGANMYGLDKKSLTYRAKWVDINSDKILNFRDNDIVDQAENKVSFVSFCFEYTRFIEYMSDNNRNVFFTYLPIQLDARCNCYQHLALLTKENLVYDKLNLAVSNFDEDPNDFYEFVLNSTNRFIENQISLLSKDDNLGVKDSEKLESYKLLRNISFDRSIVKKTIMTKSYNAGIPKQIDLIIENLDEHFDGNFKFYTFKDKELKFRREHVKTFVMALKTVIDTEIPRIKELSKYLDNIATICTRLSIPIPWKLPNGAEIYESYLVADEISLKAFSFVKSKYTFRKYIKDTFDLKKQKRSTAPNLIHSLDATTIGLLYRDLKKIGPMFTVHDCFAVTADNVDKLISKLRIVYTELYSDAGYLINFDKVVRYNINNIHGDKTFNVDSDTVNIFNKKTKKYEVVQFPDVHKVINLDINNEHLTKAMNSSYLLI